MSSTRPTRRAAARRNAVIDSDDDEIADATQNPADDSEDDFDPAAASRSSRRQSRRKTMEPPATPKGRGRAKKSIAPTEASEMLEPDQSVAAPDEEEPSKKASPRKRKSVASRASKVMATPDLRAPLPTPKASTSPEPSQLQGSPLADITSASVNEQARPAADETVLAAVKPVKAMDTVLEKPMDIVLKSRTMTVPAVEDAGPKARTVITYLILTNFKSYAGRQEVGPFHASFSSVVGPNGSGKSNVIDSLLFVFGFRASKMRQGKISALIHNSAQFPNIDHCEVAVHFQEVMDLPGGGHQVLPDSDLVISRKAFRNNSSQYYIDGKSSNFTTVTTLLRDRGVDLDHKRFLILQGEVESIAQMKAKAAGEHDDGLLEYLEDIIGTSKYKAPIEEAAAEVETLNEICMEKSGRVQHVEKEKNGLEDKKDKALAYVRDENELAMQQAALYQIYISECDDNLAVTREVIGQMQAQLEAELEQHAGSEKVIKEFEKAHAKGNRECEAQEKEVQALAREMAKFDQERVKFDEKRKFLGDKRKKLDKAIAGAESSAAEGEQTIEQCAEEIEEGAREIASLEEQVRAEEAALAKIRDGLKGKTQEFSDQIAAKQKSLEPWNDKINQKQSAIAVAESELAILREKANAGAVALEEMRTRIASIEEGRDTKAAELERRRAEKAELEREAGEVEAELEGLGREEPKFRAQLSHARQKADEARSSLSATQTRGNVLAALVRMKESGRIEGFHGRLGNLGTIDPKYDVAISTACAALDNFVTDTVEAGQQCIEYLRKTNLGRGNFICLDRLRARDLSPMATPEEAPRLFDLVRATDERFRPAFYHALQDTLVARDLAQANRIAYGAKRWRVVTLDGALIDKSGTMSGGGTSVKKGLMSSKVTSQTSKEQVSKLESDRDALEQRFQELQDRQRELESRRRDLGERIPQLDTAIQKLELEMESVARNLADAQRRAEELGREHRLSRANDDDDSSGGGRAAALREETARLGSEVEALRGETASVEDEIRALQDRIMEVGGEKLRAQRAKVDGLKEEATARGEAVSAAEVRKAKAEKQRAKLDRDHAKATRELEAAVRDLEQLEDEIRNQGDTAESLRTRVEEAREALATRREDMAELKAELDGKMTELNATRAVEIETRNKLEENQKVLAENEKRLRYWQGKLAKLALQNVQDLEKGISTAPRRPPGGDENVEEEEGEGEKDPAEKEPAADDNDDDEEDADPGDQLQAEAAASDETIRGAASASRAASGPLELPHYTKDELADMDKTALNAEIAALEEKLQSVNVDLAVLAEYRRRVEEHAARSSDLASTVAQRDAAKKRCDELRRLRLEGFMEGFSIISLRLKEMYQMITMGGNAELELVDSLDPFSEGILFSVMPPKKSWKNIGNLSGGEKTLSSLALVFALHHYKPTPLYVMDEIDAALDFRNVSIVASYIKERTKNAQFVVISLRNNMFELAARLVGVYKVNHMTKSVSIDNKDYIVRRRQQQNAQIAQQSVRG